MDSLPDLAKKTSINSLLNPEASSTHYGNPAPISPLQSSLGSAGHGEVYGGDYDTGPSFNLRAANWGTHVDRRKAENGRQYQHDSSMGMYGARHGGRRDESGYAMDGRMWINGSSPSYATGSPAIAPMYSDERTANYSQSYSQPESQWQHSQRASARIVARNSAPYYDHYATYQDPQPHSHTQPENQLPRLVQPPPKRPLPEEDSEQQAKGKRAKAAPPAPAPSTKAPSSSKRGYPAKKRNEVAQINASSAKIPQQFTTAQNGKGKEKASNGGPLQIVALGTGSQGQTLHAEIQSTRCMSSKYKNDPFPRCVACTRRWAGDTCRFQGIRYFLRDSESQIVGVTFTEKRTAELPSMKFPSRWNEPLTMEIIQRTKKTVARALLPTLRQELKHLKVDTIIHRPREREVRATCDTCMTSIFSSSWLCRLCGREACFDCFSTITDLTHEPSGMDARAVAALQQKREKYSHANPFFLQCTKRVEHKAQDFSPMTRFCDEELEGAIKEMERLVSADGVEAHAQNHHHAAPPPHPYAWAGSPLNGMQQQQQQQQQQPSSLYHPEHPPPPLPPTQPPAHPALPAEILSPTYIPPNLSQTTLNTPTLALRRFQPGALTPTTFPALWARGEPLVVVGLLPGFRIDWTPEYFIQKYGSQACLVIECQTEVNRRVTVEEFFRDFGRYEARVLARAGAAPGEQAGGAGTGTGTGRAEVLKLKDWPPSTDFKRAFPELWDDFGRAVPVPGYVRRDGVLNLASHFPEDAVAPDIGPKMYNAMATTLQAGSKGSTRLHMDMADAVNIMTYSAPAPDGSPGCAAWDLFRAEDSDKIRAFLTDHARAQSASAKSAKDASSGKAPPPVDLTANDPIHGQQFYMDEDMLARLYETSGVRSYRHYQRPGEAVFIPAGCAHQVANLADCIKVAVDFVSPENVERCEKLTREFREQNHRKMWKEDVLQLRTMMWFAWLSCCQQEAQANGNEDDG
ncbi:hypothetical protein H0H92_012193 [Tricholoma furcatifolium]|nr:hypothetical protein H0H92_012193 [Tricholoma furcatifolium]